MINQNNDLYIKISSAIIIGKAQKVLDILNNSKLDQAREFDKVKELYDSRFDEKVDIEYNSYLNRYYFRDTKENIKKSLMKMESHSDSENTMYREMYNVAKTNALECEINKINEVINTCSYADEVFISSKLINELDRLLTH